MQKEFNDTGLCVPHRHYMVDISAKIEKISELVAKGKYFTINRPRQFGKTTTLSQLARQLNQRGDYLALSISFEGIDSETYQYQDRFIATFLDILAHEFDYLKLPELVQLIEQQIPVVTNLNVLSRLITKLNQTMPTKPMVLLIDEVDKSSNNQLFLDFLAMLRNKYLQRNDGKDDTFQSVVLAGVHDVKSLKAKIRPDAEQKYNSPWNIAIDFRVDLSFSATEIATMLQDYSHDKRIQPDIAAIADKLYYYTAGYPYLVSKLCKFIDEDIIPLRTDPTWTVDDVEAAFKLIVDESYTTTLFDSLTKNLENNRELYEMVFDIIMNGKKYPFNAKAPLVNLGYLYGIFSPAPDGSCQIHNRIFEQCIYAYMMTNYLIKESEPLLSLQPGFYNSDGLNLPVILQKFQAFMKENYAQQDAKFLEREGRLLFLSFLRPILNGKGFDFKEPNVGDERRMDIVITYRNKRYVLELKIWYGEEAHQAGLQQLSNYLDLYGLSEGYLLIFDFNKHKQYKEEPIAVHGKQILAVWV